MLSVGSTCTHIVAVSSISQNCCQHCVYTNCQPENQQLQTIVLSTPESVTCADNCPNKQNGYDIQVHGGHGYLVTVPSRKEETEERPYALRALREMCRESHVVFFTVAAMLLGHNGGFVMVVCAAP